MVRGNTIIVVPSEAHPLAATDLYQVRLCLPLVVHRAAQTHGISDVIPRRCQVLDTSDLPGGVINIVTGQTDVLAKTLVEVRARRPRPRTRLCVCMCAAPAALPCVAWCVARPWFA